jgi:hypothetical protein
LTWPERPELEGDGCDYRDDKKDGDILPGFRKAQQPQCENYRSQNEWHDGMLMHPVHESDNRRIIWKHVPTEEPIHCYWYDIFSSDNN